MHPAFSLGLATRRQDPFWVDINVIDNSAVIYDFVANAPYAQWKSGAGALPFPGRAEIAAAMPIRSTTRILRMTSLDASPGC